MNGFRQRTLVIDLVLLSGALALYVRTLSPSLYTFDSAELAAGAYALGIVHAPGYPLYLVLVKLFTLVIPLGDIAYRANLFSALCAAVTLVVLRRVMESLTGLGSAALAATLVFGFSYPFWSEAVVAEVYTLNLLLMATTLYLVLRWRSTGDGRWVVAAAFALGLGLAHHLSILGFLPALALLLWQERRVRPISMAIGLRALAALAVGPLAYLYLPLRYAASPALNYALTLGVDLRTPAGVLWLVSGRMFADSAFGYSLAELPAEMLRFVGLLWQTFLGIGLLAAAVGFWDQWRRDRPLALALSLIAGGEAFFYINYRVFDKDTMFLPVFMIVGVWLALGLARFRAELMAAGRSGRLVTLAGVGLAALMLGFNYSRVDLSGNWITRRYAEGIMDLLPANSFVAGSWIDITPLEYLQVVEGARPDVTLFDWGLFSLGRRAHLRASGTRDERTLQRIIHEEVRGRVTLQLQAGRPVFALERDPLFADDYRLVQQGDLFRLYLPLD